MGKKFTTEDFIERAIKIHGDAYNYDKTNYTGSGVEVEIFCNYHSKYFLQRAGNHLTSKGCYDCGRINAKKAVTKTQSQFIEDITKVHGDAFDYSLVNYINNTTKIQIICKKHNHTFIQFPSGHLSGANGCEYCRGSIMSKANMCSYEYYASRIEVLGFPLYSVVEINGGDNIIMSCEKHGTFTTTFTSLKSCKEHNCPICRKEGGVSGVKKDTESFIKLAKEKHGDRYDYSKVNYVILDTCVEIICKQHGSTFQTPNNHLNSKTGCNLCTNELKSKNRTKTHEQFIKEAIEKYGDFYDYSKSTYKKSNEKVIIICRIHGSFQRKPKDLLYGKGCAKCGNARTAEFNRKSKEQFIIDSKSKHGDKYTYEKTEYTDSREDVILNCKTHGYFQVEADDHLQGRGCSKCAKLGTGGYGRTNYITRAKGRICSFYTLRCFNEEEEFYKIGITVNTVAKRYSTTQSMPYNYEILSEIKGEAGSIWDLERDEKKKLKKFHYEPKIDFSGSVTECFTDYKI